MRDVPIVLVIFNRLDCTGRSLAAIRLARPARLYVVADGPRASRPGEAALCAEVRNLVERGVDWPCEVIRDYAPANLGCGRRVASGLDAVFARECEAIIIEDDCIPAPEFFQYCAQLLEKYRNDARVGQICGCTVVAERVERETSYLFSRYGPVWGWASWSRAWKYYDFGMKQWPEFRQSAAWGRIIPSARERVVRARIYDDLRSGRIDTWDYQWGFAKMTHDLLSIIPCINLVENVGFGPDATHTSPRAVGLPRGRLEFPLKHPPVERDEAFDRRYSQVLAPGVLDRIVARARRLFAA